MLYLCPYIFASAFIEILYEERIFFTYFTFAIIILSLASCTATKYVPDGSYLLDEVKIHTDQKMSVLLPYECMCDRPLMPNGSVLIKTQFYVYNLSGRDSTKWGK